MESNREPQTQNKEKQGEKTKNNLDFGGLKKNLRNVGFLLLGVIVFFVVFQFVGWSKILSSLKQLDPILFLLAMGCIFCSISLWTMRWDLFLGEKGYKVSFFSLFKYLVVGLAVNNMTPLAKFGGEPVRAYLLREKEDIRMREGLATVLAELSVFLFVLVGVILLGITLYYLLMSPPLWVGLLLIPFGAFVLLVFYLIKSIYSGSDYIVRFLNWIGKKVGRIKPYRDKIERVYRDFRKAFKKSLENRRTFTKAIGLSLSMKVFDMVKFFLLFKALGYEIEIIEILIMMGLSAIILSIPSTPGSLGVLEGGLVFVLTTLGVPVPTAATVVFLNRLVWFWGITAAGGTLGAHYGVSILESKGAKV